MKKNKHIFSFSWIFVSSLVFLWLLPLILQFFGHQLIDFSINEKSYYSILYTVIFLFILVDFYLDKKKILWIVEFFTGFSNRK